MDIFIVIKRNRPEMKKSSQLKHYFLKFCKKTQWAEMPYRYHRDSSSHIERQFMHTLLCTDISGHQPILSDSIFIM